ncbi:MAG: AsmA family protein [Alphaproteobacteria bacterium]|nr:AsmA family protein [Alphaproteobacteria bacterium]
MISDETRPAPPPWRRFVSRYRVAVTPGGAAMWLLRALGSVFTGLIMLVLGVGALVYYGGDPFMRELIEKQGSATLERRVTLGPAFHLAWGAPLRVYATDVHVANVPWGTGPDMFAAGRAEIDLDPWPLLHFQFRYQRIALENAKVLLETSNKGEGNWSTGTSAVAPQTRTEFPDVEDLEIKSGSFTWHNGVTNATTLVTFSQASAKTPDTTSPIALALAGTFQHEPYDFTARVGPLGQLQDPTRPYPVRFEGEVSRTKVSIDGKIARPLAFEGLDVALAVAGANLQDFAKLFTIPVPETPPYRLAGRLTHDGNRWAIARMDGRMGESRLTGDLLVDPSGKLPYIKADLASPLMDLADFKGFYGEEPAHTGASEVARARTPADKRAAARKQAEKADPNARVIPETAIPLKQLSGFNADVVFDGREIKRTSGVPFEHIKLDMSLKDGTLELKPLDFAVAGGTVAMRLVLVSTAHPVRSHADITVRRIDLNRLFRATPTMKEVKETSGIFGGFIRFDSTGDSERAVLANMTGDFGFFMEGGQFSELLIDLVGLDVFHAAVTYLEGDRPVPINCLAARFSARNGIATAQTLLFDTTPSTILGQGNVDLHDETINLRFVPQPKEFSPLSLRSPIDVSGALGHPSVRPEAKTLIARLGAAIGLGVAAGPAAILPLTDLGADVKGACAIAFAAHGPAVASSTGRPAARGGGR